MQTTIFVCLMLLFFLLNLVLGLGLARFHCAGALIMLQVPFISVDPKQAGRQAGSMQAGIKLQAGREQQQVEHVLKFF